jgi:lipoprotein-anchoring transpeptidase ErfK/SrfK
VRCYGPYFLRLSTKRDETFAQKSRWEGIGIHGTLERDLYSTDRSRVVCGPSALGAHSSEGCVRMHNSHLLDLIERIKRIDGDLLGLRVTIVDGVNRL